jgi:hypothetical protein
LLFACILQVWGNDLTLSVVSGDCYLLEFYRSGAIPRSCQWSPAILFACMLQVWSNLSTLSGVSGDCYFLGCCRYTTLSMESGDYYLFDYCKSGALVRPCQWSLVIVFFACVLQVWSNCSTLSVESGDCFLVLFSRPGAIIRPCQWSWF